MSLRCSLTLLLIFCGSALCNIYVQHDTRDKNIESFRFQDHLEKDVLPKILETPTNSITIQILTSKCWRAGSNARFHLWFGEGYMGTNSFEFLPVTPVLGPFTIEANQLESGGNLEITSNKAIGDESSVQYSLAAVVIKKEYTNFFDSLTDGWKPERINMRWKDAQGQRVGGFIPFSSSCERNWLTKNDFYMANTDGRFLHMKNSGNLLFEDIFADKFKGEVVDDTVYAEFKNYDRLPKQYFLKWTVQSQWKQERISGKSLF